MRHLETITHRLHTKTHHTAFLWPYRAGRRLMAASASTFAKASADKSRSSPSFPPQVRPPPPSQGPPSEGRDWRGPAMEETMGLWTIGELMHLTRDELCNLAATIAQSLTEFEAGTIERLDALTSLDNIRRVMVRRDLNF
jgi:hypothetical protein